jgi:exopolyphosphatase/guanosine-5'-triphosphate,3'-diphosphate pyrophosphatase
MFDALAEAHGLGAGDRELLGHAARLHEVGNAISPARYHKHGAYLVENAGLRGFDPTEVAMLASIVRFQRGKDPRPVFAPFADLPSDRREVVIDLIAMLRVAHAIGRGDEPEGLEVAVRVSANALRIRVVGSTHPVAVVAETRDAAGLLERRLSRTVEIDARAQTETAAS